MIIKVKVFPVIFDNQDGSFSFTLYPSKEAAIADFIEDKECYGPLSKQEKKELIEEFLSIDNGYENGYHSLDTPSIIEIDTETKQLVKNFRYSS